MLAALRLKQRPPGPQMQTIVLQVEYAAFEDRPRELGPAYTYYVPKAQLNRAWVQEHAHEV
jgi:hypothetical protein